MVQCSTIIIKQTNKQTKRLSECSLKEWTTCGLVDTASPQAPLQAMRASPPAEPTQSPLRPVGSGGLHDSPSLHMHQLSAFAGGPVYLFVQQIFTGPLLFVSLLLGIGDRAPRKTDRASVQMESITHHKDNDTQTV